MGALKELNRDDLLNRFASHTFTETTVDDHTLVEFKNGSSVLIASARNEVVDDAYKSIREALVGTAGEIMFSLTPTQRDALSSLAHGTNIHNHTDFGIDTYHLEWHPASNWIQSTVKSVTTTDATVTTIETLTLDDDSVYLVRASIVTIESGGGDLGGGEIECLAKRLSAGSAAIQGTVVDLIRRGTNGSLNFDFVVSGNDLLAQVTGLAATTMKWESIVKYRKLSG